MNTMVNMIKESKEKEAGMKRPATNITQTTPVTPRKQQKGQTTSNLTMERMTFFPYDTQSEEASYPPNSSQHTFSEESADEAMMPKDASGEGAGQ